MTGAVRHGGASPQWVWSDGAGRATALVQRIGPGRVAVAVYLDPGNEDTRIVLRGDEATQEAAAVARLDDLLPPTVPAEGDA